MPTLEAARMLENAALFVFVFGAVMVGVCVVATIMGKWTAHVKVERMENARRMRQSRVVKRWTSNGRQ